jgi:hypothetical protein
MRVWTVTLIVLCAVSFGGCCSSCKEKLFESAIEKAVESGGDGKSKAKLDLSKGTFTVTNEKGEAVKIAGGDKGSLSISNEKGESLKIGSGAGTKIPDTWPKDVPIYAGSKPMSTMETGKGSTVVFESTDPPAKVWDYYVTTLPAKGWTVVIKSQSGEGGFASFEKKAEKRAVIITVSSSDGKTTGTVSASQN